MKPLLFILIAGLFTLTRAGLASPENFPQDPAVTRAQCVTHAQQRVAVWEDVLQRELGLLARGMGSQGDVEAARLALAGARHDLAYLLEKQALVEAQWKVILGVRERQVATERLLRERGVGADMAVEAAERRLANARLDRAIEMGNSSEATAQLRYIIELSQHELDHNLRLHARGYLGEGDVNFVRRRLAYARFRLALLEEDPEVAVQSAGQVVLLRQGEYDRLRRLHDRSAVGQLEVDLAHIALTQARQWLALAQGNPASLRDLVRGEAALYEGLLRDIVGRRDLSPETLAQVRFSHALARWRLVASLDEPYYFWLGSSRELDE